MRVQNNPLLLIILMLPLFARAGDITISCDSRTINEKACIGALDESLKELGCTRGETRCILHPWGSDFIKSWVCTAQSPNCSSATQASCGTGFIHEFNETTHVCIKSDSKTVHGVCNHQQAEHSFSVKECADGVVTCSKFGGIPSQCTQPKGYSGQSEVSCQFPSIKVQEWAANCTELKAKCGLTNSEKGVLGIVLNCLTSQ